MQTTKLSTDTLRRLALMQHLGEDFFILNGIAYVGTEESIKDEYNVWNESDEPKDAVSFEQWLNMEDNWSLTEVEELEENDYSIDYMVLTDEEADEKATDYIKDSLWAFTPYFLSEITDLPEDVFQSLADNGRCESNNDSIERIVNKTCGIDKLVQSAISTDGRGHFLSSYDGNENKETVEGETFYIYRTN